MVTYSRRLVVCYLLFVFCKNNQQLTTNNTCIPRAVFRGMS